MSAYRKGGTHSQTWYVTVVDQHGRKHRLATATHDRETAEDMELMLRALTRKGSRDWDLVRPLLEKDPRRSHRRRLALARLYDHWRTGTLDTLRAELADVDLSPGIDQWVAFITTHRAAETVRGYTQRIAVLAPVDEAGQRAPLWRSAVTPAWLATQRDTVPGIPNQIAHLTAWSSCCTFLVERGLLAENPCSKVKWPTVRKTGERVRHIARLADVQRFVAAFPDAQDRAIAALREGVGADWDAIQPMRREHIVDPAKRLVFLPGDKHGHRMREVQLEAWAWKHVAAYLATLPSALPSAPLFTRVYETYKAHHRETRHALIAAGVALPKGYAPHNSRHSFAVRKRRAGWDDWKIAAYLGNTAQEVARTYGAFHPTREDMHHGDAEEANG